MTTTYDRKNIGTMNLKEKAFDYGISKQAIPEYISNNLKYEFFDWQNNAFENLLINQKPVTRNHYQLSINQKPETRNQKPLSIIH